MTQSNGFISVTLPSDFFFPIRSLSLFFLLLLLWWSRVCALSIDFSRIELNGFILQIHFDNNILWNSSHPPPIPTTPEDVTDGIKWKKKIDRINVIDPVLNYLVKCPTINAVFPFLFLQKLCLFRIVKFQHGSRSPASYGTRKQKKNKKKKGIQIYFVFMGGKVRERESATHASVNQSKTKVIF